MGIVEAVADEQAAGNLSRRVDQMVEGVDPVPMGCRTEGFEIFGKACRLGLHVHLHMQQRLMVMKADGQNAIGSPDLTPLGGKVRSAEHPVFQLHAGIDALQIQPGPRNENPAIHQPPVDLTREPAVVTVGQFDAGVRNNIIPDRARLVGTIRTFDDAMRTDIHARVRRIAEGVAAAHGTTVRVEIQGGYPVTTNDPALTQRMLPTLERVAPGQVRELTKVTGAEDFSFFANRVPGLFVMVGVTPADQMATAASNHSPRFYVDEAALPTGSRALVQLAADYLFASAR